MGKLKDEQLENDAWTINSYITLESIENELEEVDNVFERGDGYPSLEKVRAVLKRAAEL